MPVLFDTLESRQMFAFSPPTAAEQYLIELINRARLNPTAAATGLGVSLNEGLSAGTIGSASRQPLAVNGNLVEASEIQAQYLRTSGQSTYVGPGGTLPLERITNSGYPDSGTIQSSAEDITLDVLQAGTGLTQSVVQGIFRNLFVDAGTSGRTNRANLFGPSFREIGAGLDVGLFGPLPLPPPGVPNAQVVDRRPTVVVGAVDLARNTGNAAGDVFLTGVTYNDADGDQFYTPGEGLGGITITARRLTDNATFTGTSYASGGYSIRLPNGTYDVIATGTGLLAGGGSGSVRLSAVTVNGENEKRDFTTQQGAATPPAPGPVLPPGEAPSTLTGDITGRVLYDRRGDGRGARFDPVVVGTKVYADTDNDGVLDDNENFGLVQSDGTYTVTGISAGLYNIRVQPPAGYRVSLPDTGFRSVTVSAGSFVKVRPLAITERTVISGRVYRDDNANGNYDPVFDRGLAGFRVYLDANNDGIWQRETEPSRLSNPQGKYAFRDLLAGTYVVRVIPRAAFLQTEPTTPGSYTVTLPATGLDYLDRDFGERLIG
ncbi:MAG: hypothetical protein JWO31_4133 [Phycisphaerales bacterium]|nr:hypothetical protein [Phycisphaerales bacterium]